MAREASRQEEEVKAMPREESAQKPRAKSASTGIVSVGEAVNLYRGEWIAMRVTNFDENQVPSAGVVFAHSRSYSRVCTKLSKEVKAPLHPGSHFYVFLGEPRGRRFATTTGGAGLPRRPTRCPEVVNSRFPCISSEDGSSFPFELATNTRWRWSSAQAHPYLV
jgi:hypothetical protein